MKRKRLLYLFPLLIFTVLFIYSILPSVSAQGNFSTCNFRYRENPNVGDAFYNENLSDSRLGWSRDDIIDQRFLFVEVTNTSSDGCNAAPFYFLMSPESGLARTSDGGDYFFASPQDQQNYIAIDGNYANNSNNALIGSQGFWEQANIISIRFTGSAENFFQRTNFGEPQGSSGFIDNIAEQQNPSDEVGDGSQGDDSQEETCESQGISAGWIICQILDLADSALQFADAAIIDLFEVQREFYDNETIKSVWSAMRNIALFIIVPMFLIMVIGTALGFDFVNAYTVKKALPRLIIAVIFIVFSYEITVFAVQITDTIARGIAGLIYTPFGVTSADLTLQSLFTWQRSEGEIALANTAVIILGGVGASFVMTGGLFVLMGVLGAAALAVLAILLLLALRQMLILALILVAPLAILAWIFPANTKLWSLWEGSFMKLLLIYPVIVFLTAVGRVFAYMIAETIFR